MLLFQQLFVLLLQPAVKPVEECALPQYAVLWLQYPVVLVREDEQLSRNTPEPCGIECSHALVGIDTVVKFSVDAQNRSVPLIDKLVRTVLVCTLGIC